jgi:hypothetical protein
MNIQRRKLIQLFASAATYIGSPVLGYSMSSCLLTSAHAQPKPQPQALDAAFSVQANTLRQSRDRVFDLKTGRLGNLRHLHIQAAGLAVIIRPGPENRVTRGSHSVAINPLPASLNPENLKPLPRDLELSMAQPINGKAAWVLIEVATLQDLYIATEGTTVWLDKVNLPWLRIMGHDGQVALTDVNIGHLHLDLNGTGSFVATGQVESLFMSAQTPGSSFYLQDLIVKLQTHVLPKNLDQFFALNIEPNMKAFYNSPIQTGQNLRGFEVQVKGVPEQLIFSGPGRAKVSTLSSTTVQKTRTLLEAVTKRVPI